MAPPAKTRTLYVGGLPPSASLDALRAAFGRFGPLEDVRLLPRREVAIAYVTFASESAAFEARRALDGANLAGHRLRVEFAT